MWMVPSSSMSTCAPDSATIFWIMEPPLPMTSRILSTSIFMVSILGAILGDMVTRLGDAGDHDLVQDLKAGLAAALERVGDDLHGQTVVLQVHLDGGDALGGTGDLEVHLAVEVLNALDVGEGPPRAGLLVGDEAAGNAGDGALDGHARVHQSQRGAADGGLGGRAVGGDDLGDDADGVRELVNGRDHGQQGLFGQRAVADLAAGGGAARTGFAGGPLRHIIVVDIAALGLVIDGVELLRGGERVQRADGENLRLAAGEQAGAVDARQNADLGSPADEFRPACGRRRACPRAATS